MTPEPGSTRPLGRSLAAEALCAACVVAMLALTAVRLSACIGRGHFLADQVDQLQQLDQVSAGHLDGLYGPWWSGTSPQVRALGPLSTLAFGIPTRLGLDPDGVHAVFLGLLLASVAAFYAWVRRLDPWLALAWTALILASPYTWWIGSMFWVNVLLAPVALLFAGGVVAYARTPGGARAAWLALFVFLGLHVHSTPAIAFLLLAAVGVDLWRRRSAAPLRLRPSWRLAIGAAAIAGPYLVVELANRGRNTSAILENLGRHGANRSEGWRAARESLEAAIPILGLSRGPGDAPATSGAAGWLAAAALAAIALGLGWRAVRRWSRGTETPGEALALAAVLVVVGQAAFFTAVNRPIGSRHYLLFALPWMVLPVALAVRLAAAWLGRWGPALVVVLSAGAYALGWSRAPPWLETTDWSWRTISGGMARICAEHPAVRLHEPADFAPPGAGIDSVLRYVARRAVPACTVDPEAPVLVAPDRAGSPPATLSVEGVAWRRTELIPPGLGVYERASGG